MTDTSTKIPRILVIDNLAKMDLAVAERILAAYYSKYPGLAEFHKEMAAKLDYNPRPLAERIGVLLPIPLKAIPHEKRENVRVSTKTGATWPKPKGSY